MPSLKTLAVGLLRQSERYTKTDMVYLAGNGGWSLLNQGGIALLALLVSVAFANLVPEETYGTYRFLLSVFWTLAAFSLTGVPTVLARAVARGEEGTYRDAMRLTFWGSLPMALGALALGGYYFANENMMLALGALSIALIAPWFGVGYLFAPYLEGKRDFRRKTLYGIALNGLPSLAVIGAMFLTADPVSLFLIYMGGSGIVALLLAALVFRIYRPNREKHAELSSYGTHLSVMNVISTVATQLDQLLVFHYLGPATLAAYAFATSLPDQIKNLASTVGTLAFPKFVTRPMEEIRKLLAFRIFSMSALLLVVIGIYVALAPFVFALLFPAYQDAVIYSQIYALTLLPIGSVLPVAALQAHAAKRELYIFNIATAVVQIGTLFAGILWLGLIGVILARLAYRVFYLALAWALVHSYKLPEAPSHA